MAPGRVDRSPCGTGSSANLAVRHTAGKLGPGERLVSCSIIGGEFVTRVLGELRVGPYQAIRNRVSGQAWIYAITQVGLDPDDPFPAGFTLSDIWGGGASA